MGNFIKYFQCFAWDLFASVLLISVAPTINIDYISGTSRLSGFLDTQKVVFELKYQVNMSIFALTE